MSGVTPGLSECDELHSQYAGITFDLIYLKQRQKDTTNHSDQKYETSSLSMLPKSLIMFFGNCKGEQIWADIPMVGNLQYAANVRRLTLFVALTGGQTCNVIITHYQPTCLSIKQGLSMTLLINKKILP